MKALMKQYIMYAIEYTESNTNVRDIHTYTKEQIAQMAVKLKSYAN